MKQWKSDAKPHLPERPGIGVDLVEEDLEKHPGVRGMNKRENLYV